MLLLVHRAMTIAQAVVMPVSAFIFFGGITGTKTADADADVILNGGSASDQC